MVDRIAICGPVEYCRERLAEMPGYGATLTLVPVPAQGTTAEKWRLIESLIA
jgi:hypothetical protein